MLQAIKSLAHQLISWVKENNISVIFMAIFFCYALFKLVIAPKTDFYYKVWSKTEKYGTQYNSVRKSRGIPILPDEWYTKNTKYIPSNGFGSRKLNITNRQVWHPKKGKDNALGHFEKQIDFDDSGIDFEIDRYVCCSNSEYLLEVTFNYQTRSFSYFFTTFSNGYSESIYLNKPQLDSIQKAWNF